MILQFSNSIVVVLETGAPSGSCVGCGTVSTCA